MRPFLRRIWHRLRANLETQQITRAGLLFVLAIALVAFAAFASANNLLFLILAAMISTLLMSGFVSKLSIAALELEMKAPPHIPARRNVPAQVLLKNGKSWMASFSIHLSGTGDTALPSSLYFPVIPGGATIEQTVTLLFARRGLHQNNAFQFTTRFPFGFAERRANVTLRQDLLVYPCLDPQPGFEDLLISINGEIEAHQRGRGDEFYRLRPYETFESARFVDWKATAHTKELQVREFTREQDRTVVLVLDLNVPHDSDEWFEKAVDCCAFLAWHIASRGARLRLVTQRRETRLPEDGDIYTVLRDLALVQPQAGGSLPAHLANDTSSYQIYFSARPDLDLPDGARLLSPDSLRPEPATPQPAG
ncbi:MAG: DUF58 domain-containing protein [Bryobacteraceae bacterium]